MLPAEESRPDIVRKRARWKSHQHRVDAGRLVFIDETWVKTNTAPLRGGGRPRFTLRQLDQALKIARQEAGALRGMVSIGLPSTTLAPLGLPLVRAVSPTYPGILLNVVEGLSGRLAQMMRLGQLDLAVLFTANIATDLHAQPLIDEELFVILPKDSPLQETAKDSVTLAEAAALPLILPTGLHGLRRRIDAAFDARDLTPRVVAEIDSLSLLLDCEFDGV